MGRNNVKVKGVTMRGKSVQITFNFNFKTYRFTERLSFAAAVQKRERIMKAIEIGKYTELDLQRDFPGNAKPLSDWATMPVYHAVARFTDERKDIKESTRQNYSDSVSRIKTSPFAQVQVQDLRWADIKDFYQSLRISNKARRVYMAPLKVMYQELFDDERISNNPFAGHRLKAEREAPKKIDPFTMNEVETLAPYMPPSLENMVRFISWTGLRLNEAIALRWKDVDEKEVLIHRGRVRGIEGTTKTDQDRLVTLLPPALDILRKQKAVTMLQPHGHVFDNPDTGKPWKNTDELLKTGGRDKRSWGAYLRKAKVRYRPPRNLRHTFASTMLSAGENPAWVASQLGHAKVSTTLTYYATWIPQERNDAGMKAVKLHQKLHRTK